MHRLGGKKRVLDEGATAVELAVALPLILLLLFGIVEFGRFVALSTAVETASREAARFGSAVGGALPQYLDCAGIKSAGQRLAVVADIDPSEIVVVYDSGPGSPLLAADCQGGVSPTAGTIKSGDRIVVTVTDTFQSIVPVFGDILGTVTISSTDARTIFKGSL